MSKQKRRWIYSPSKSNKTVVPENIKRDLEIKAKLFIDEILKPKHVQLSPDNTLYNYIVDIYTKWYRHYLYLCAKYHNLHPNAISPSFEVKFARLEYIGESKFNLSYMRHTEQWFELYRDLTIEQCLAIIKEDPNFYS